MAKFNATPVVVTGLVVAGALAGWWLSGRNRSQAGEPPTLEILTPPAGTTIPSGTRVDFSALALSGTQDISNLINWRIIEPEFLAQEWATGPTTFFIPNFLETRIVTMEAYVLAPAPGASARRSVTVTVTQALHSPRPLRDRREPTVLSVVNSFRRSDTGWRVWGRGQGVLEEPLILSRR